MPGRLDLLLFCLPACALAVCAALWARERRARRLAERERGRLQAQCAAAVADQRQLQELEAQLSTLRHDLRGILSPALLVADRLSNNEDPAVRRVGEVVIRTVERANERLKQTKPG